MQSFLIGGLAGGFFVFFWGIGGWLGLGFLEILDFLEFLDFLDFLEILEFLGILGILYKKDGVCFCAHPGLNGGFLGGFLFKDSLDFFGGSLGVFFLL
ncbi:MAG: hypothetical protein MSS61_05695 [Bacteroidales bacterium]|nr:hypothetical protein [Bacteroidales bacterium]